MERRPETFHLDQDRRADPRLNRTTYATSQRRDTLVDVLTAFLAPDLNQLIGFIVIPCIVAEIWIAGYLLTISVNTNRIAKPAAPVLA